MAGSVAQKAWLITGASSGLGLELGLAALRADHRVIGTGRNIQKAASDNPNFEKLGGKWLQVDVSESKAQEIVAKAIADEEESSGRGATHWVIVNNAGNTVLGVVEDMSEGQLSNYLQANVFGCIRVWKAALPTLRHHRQGTLITTSSIWGFVAKSEHMMYSAVKATTESLTEAYAGLLAPFGVRTMIVEPGGFRTPFASNHSVADGGISKDYQGIIQAWVDVIEAAGRDPTIVAGDPERYGTQVVDAVEAQGQFKEVWAEQDNGKVLRVLLGSDCHDLFGQKINELRDGYNRMAEIAKSTDIRV